MFFLQAVCVNMQIVLHILLNMCLHLWDRYSFHFVNIKSQMFLLREFLYLSENAAIKKEYIFAMFLGVKWPINQDDG